MTAGFLGADEHPLHRAFFRRGDEPGQGDGVALGDKRRRRRRHGARRDDDESGAEDGVLHVDLLEGLCSEMVRGAAARVAQAPEPFNQDGRGLRGPATSCLLAETDVLQAVPVAPEHDVLPAWPVHCGGAWRRWAGAAGSSTAQTPLPPTFSRDIAPIVWQRCAECHRPDGAAPFSLLTYDDVRRRARQIADATGRGYMPPWMPEGDGDSS